MKAESALKARKRYESTQLSISSVSNSKQERKLSAMHTVKEKSPTLDDSANILEILYTF